TVDPVIFDLDELASQGKIGFYTRLNYEAGMKEVIGVPLREKNKCIGFWGVFTNQKQSFQKNHLRIFQAISNQITIAVANILTNEDILERENEKSMLLCLSNDITSCRTYQDIQKIVSNNLPKYFQVNEILICLNSPDSLTHKIYSADLSQETMNHPSFGKIVTMNYFVNDGVV